MTKLILSFVLALLTAGCSAIHPQPVEAAAPICCGDCDGNSKVIASEVGKAERIGDGSEPLSLCPAADCNGDLVVSPGEVEEIRRLSLVGCPCCGDCNGDRSIAPGEVGKAQSIFNGTRPLSLCPAADCNRDGVLSSIELDTVKKNSVGGCPK